MADDLKRQATEMYRERADRVPLPTTDALSMKKLIWAALGVVVLCLAGIYLVGGFKGRKDPVIAAATPPPVVKEEPPPSLLEPAPAAPAAPRTPPPTAPAASQAAPPSAATNAAARTPEPAVSSAAPEPAPPRLAARAGQAKAAAAKSTAGKGKPAPPEPAGQASKPEVAVEQPSPMEIARREAARDVVLAKNPGLGKLYADAGRRDWSAESSGGDTYRVAFTLPDAASGAMLQYVWKVDISTRDITPLSYYARKLR